MQLDFSKILDISLRASFAALITALLLLFFPDAYLPFSIEEFRKEYGFYVFIVLCTSLSIVFSYTIKWLIEFIRRKIETHNVYSGYKFILKNLSDDEKLYLKPLYENRKSAIMLDLGSPVVKKLQTFRVLQVSVGTSIVPRGLAPGFVQPWVFELLDKNPRFLEISTKE